MRRDPGTCIALASALWFAAAAAAALAGAARGPVLSDDAYYYFEIARNAALGRGFSFDGLAPTNGFHPLWALLLVPLFWALPGEPWPPVELALAGAAAFSAGTAVVIQRLFARRGAPRAGALAAGLWLLNPFTVVLCFRGLETSLHGFLLALSIASLDGLRARGTWRRGELLRLGASVGLCGLARTDSVFWALAVGLALAPGGLGVRALVEWGRRGALVAAAAGALLLPWVAWSLARFGTLVQTSGVAKARFDLFGHLPRLEMGAGLPASLVRNVDLLVQDAGFFVLEPFGLTEKTLFVWTLLVLVDAVWLVRLGRRLRRSAAQIALPAPAEARGAAALDASLRRPFAVLLVLHVGFYAFVARNYAHWYAATPVLLACILHGTRLAPWLAQARRSRLYAFAALGLLLAAWSAVGHLGKPSILEAEARGKATRLLEGSGRRIGLLNAGAAGYFLSFYAPTLSVINLDGLVNNAITGLRDEAEFERYVLTHIDVFAEDPARLAWVLSPERASRFAAQHLRCVEDRRVGPLCAVVP